jgi:hypothetical protein
MTVDSFLICDDAGLGADGRGYMTGIFDVVTSAGFWVQMANVMVVARLRGAPGESADAVLTWTASDGTPLLQERWTLVVGPRGTAFTATEMAGPRLPAPGDYRLTLSVAGRVLATLVLPAVLEAPAPRRVH